jgi:hypothetical protein
VGIGWTNVRGGGSLRVREQVRCPAKKGESARSHRGELEREPLRLSSRVESRDAFDDIHRAAGVRLVGSSGSHCHIANNDSDAGAEEARDDQSRFFSPELAGFRIVGESQHGRSNEH